MAKKIYQIQIALKRSKPKIWRRVLIPSDLLLSDFHMVIQITMGWTNTHLHQFVKDRIFYSVRMPDDDFWNEMNSVDYKGMNVSSLLKKEKDSIVYEYDFGDGWEHQITLEKILPPDTAVSYPVCIGGKRSCPPEDVGGIWGYEEMLEILKNPDHEEFESYMDWLNEEFDPAHFDLVAVNNLLKKKNYGAFSW